jgi:hypothetical protein
MLSVRRLAFLSLAILASAGAVRAAPQDSPVVFTLTTEEAGIDFEHRNGASAAKYMPETMGSGGLIFDYDNDGWPDILLVDGGSFLDAPGAAARHRLYRNDGGRRFLDVTDSSGIRHSGFGMGVCAADYDNDGWTDVYFTNVYENVLYRNTGGMFLDVTEAAGVGSELWSTSCAFGDVDNDGDVDLYVANYVDFAVDNNKYCGDVEGIRFYCHPNIYNGLPDVLYRNNGDGTFADVSRESGVFTADGKGLGVVFSDFDDDLWTDIYVANDSVPNFMFRNTGNGVFEEAALWLGVAVGGDGQPLAGMGTDIADVDGDGLQDIFVTNLDRQTHSLYRNVGGAFFDDVTYSSGVGEATLPYVGFGAAFLDFDNDMDLDLAIANGDVLDNIALLKKGATYEQTNLLLMNDGTGRFRNVSPDSGSGFALEKVSRGLVTGDLDNDGDLDILVTNNGQPPDLLWNDGGRSGRSLQIRLVGTGSNRDGIGARLELTVAGRVQVREVRAGSSYLGQNDLRVHFGMGSESGAERLRIRWPSGRIDVLENLPADEIITVREGGEITARRSLANPR